MTKLNVIEGIGPTFEAKLIEAGVKNIEDLLEKGATKEGRAAIAEKTEISDKLVLRWINHADLMRVKGVRGEYSELLEASGLTRFRSWPAQGGQPVRQNVAVNEEKSWCASSPPKPKLRTGSNRPRH